MAKVISVKVFPEESMILRILPEESVDTVKGYLMVFPEESWAVVIVAVSPVFLRVISYPLIGEPSVFAVGAVQVDVAK